MLLIFFCSLIKISLLQYIPRFSWTMQMYWNLRNPQFLWVSIFSDCLKTLASLFAFNNFFRLFCVDSGMRKQRALVIHISVKFTTVFCKHLARYFKSSKIPMWLTTKYFVNHISPPPQLCKFHQCWIS